MTALVDNLHLWREICDRYKELKKASFSVNKSLVEACKSKFKAEQFREVGNEQYAHANIYRNLPDYREILLKEALNSYTKSVAYAPENSEELALAYGNRSAVLFELGKYVPCILDVNRAVRGNFPNVKLEKLSSRRERCLEQIRLTKGNDCGITGFEVEPIELSNQEEKEFKWRINVCKFGNRRLPNSSPKIDLVCDQQRRTTCLTACDNIAAGEILSSEEFFLLDVIQFGGHYKKCSYCIIDCDALIPCTSCNAMLYCSEKCRIQAYESYHRTECQMWPFYHQESSSMKDLFAVRALLIGTSQGLQLDHLMRTLPIQNVIFEEKVDIRSETLRSDYITSLKLPMNFDLQRVKSRIKTCVKVIIALEELSFFIKNESWKEHRMNDAELFATALLLNHYESLSDKSFPIHAKALHPISSFDRNQSQQIGLGTLLLQKVQYSCNPNARVLVRKREQVLFAVRPIAEGERITIANGDCRCKTCVRNLNFFSDPLKTKIEVITESKIEAIQAILNVAAPIMRTEINIMPPEILQIVIEFLNLLYIHTQPSSVLVTVCEDILTQFLNIAYVAPGLFYADQFDNKFFKSKIFETLREMTFVRNTLWVTDPLYQIMLVIEKLYVYALAYL